MAHIKKVSPQQWVTAYADYLYAFALKRIPDTELCKDIVQDTFLSAIKNISQYKGKSSEQTWLTAILKNKILDHYRKKSSSLGFIESLSKEDCSESFFESNGHWKQQHGPLNWGVEDEDYLENKELKSVLAHCIEKLPAPWALVFNMKYLDEEDSKKICKELHFTPSNFWIIVHRAKVNLRACISKNWEK